VASYDQTTMAWDLDTGLRASAHCRDFSK
jgi:hypothetical protein